MKFGVVYVIGACVTMVAGCSSTSTTARPVITRAGARPAPGSAVPPRVYLASGQDISQPALFEPRCAHGCPLSADSTAILSGMTWSTWTSQIATGSGTYNIDSCEPSCANGKVYREHAIVTLSLPVKACLPAGDRYYFSRVAFKFPSGLPAALQGGNAPQNPWMFSPLIDQARQSCA